LRHHRHRPDFALVKFKKLAGAAISRSSTAPSRGPAPLGYDEKQIATSSLCVGRRRSPMRRAQSCGAESQGLPEAAIDKVEAALAGAFDIRSSSTSGRSERRR